MHIRTRLHQHLHVCPLWPRRRVHTMEWITGVKLTTLPPEEIRSFVKVGQEAFLTQLLEIGYFHGVWCVYM